jgi:hypothetical protein
MIGWNSECIISRPMVNPAPAQTLFVLELWHARMCNRLVLNDDW